MINFLDLLFYMFSGTMILSSILVISARNSVHSVLFLILAFFNAAGLFVLLRAEFLAMMLVIVYVGAVAVLFLFVVMMLNLSLKPKDSKKNSYLVVGGTVGLVFLLELLFVNLSWTSSPESADLIAMPFGHVGGKNNTEMLGNILYTHFVLIFQGAGLILLVAMLGAIVLTLRTRPGVRKQDIYEQLKREPKDSVELVDMPIGQGVKL